MALLRMPLRFCWLPLSPLLRHFGLHKDKNMTSKPNVMQGKQAAKQQDPSPLKGKWVTGTRKGQRKGGDRARKGRRCWLSLFIHNSTPHTRLQTQFL